MPGIITVKLSPKSQEVFCNVEVGYFNNYENEEYWTTDWSKGALKFTDNDEELVIGGNLRMSYFGEVSSINRIDRLPSVGKWNNGKVLAKNGGYIIEGTINGKLYYFRLYISDLTKNASGKVVGITYEYQQFVPNC